MDQEYNALSFRDFDGNARKILGIGDFAKEEEIQQAFRALAFRFHPDKCGAKPECVVKFRAVVAAYEWLTKGTVDKAAIPFLEDPESLGKARVRETYMDWWKRTFYNEDFPIRLESSNGDIPKKKKKKEIRRFPL